MGVSGASPLDKVLQRPSDLNEVFCMGQARAGLCGGGIVFQLPDRHYPSWI